MIAFEYTEDKALIRSIALSPNNITWLADEKFKNRDTWEPPFQDDLRYLLIKDNDEVMGFYWLYNRMFFVECHMALLPKAYGKSVKYGKKGVKWVFENTKFKLIIAPVVYQNRLACKMTEKIGFKRYGTVKDAFLKDGRLLNMIMHKFHIDMLKINNYNEVE